MCLNALHEFFSSTASLGIWYNQCLHLKDDETGAQRGFPALDHTTRMAQRWVPQEQQVRRDCCPQALKESPYGWPVLYCTKNAFKNVILVDPHVTLWSRHCYHHFTNVETEIQKE